MKSPQIEHTWLQEWVTQSLPIMNFACSERYSPFRSKSLHDGCLMRCHCRSWWWWYFDDSWEWRCYYVKTWVVLPWKFNMAVGCGNLSVLFFECALQIRDVTRHLKSHTAAGKPDLSQNARKPACLRKKQVTKTRHPVERQAHANGETALRISSSLQWHSHRQQTL